VSWIITDIVDGHFLCKYFWRTKWFSNSYK